MVSVYQQTHHFHLCSAQKAQQKSIFHSMGNPHHPNVMSTPLQTMSINAPLHTMNTPPQNKELTKRCKKWNIFVFIKRLSIKILNVKLLGFFVSSYLQGLKGIMLLCLRGISLLIKLLEAWMKNFQWKIGYFLSYEGFHLNSVITWVCFSDLLVLVFSHFFSPFKLSNVILVFGDYGNIKFQDNWLGVKINLVVIAAKYFVIWYLHIQHVVIL